jgi:uncharacterized protein (DUF433 family)
MTDQPLLERITLNPKVRVGKPVLRGTHLTVAFILNLLAHGTTSAEILAEYDGLTQEDLQACLLFAARWKLPPSCHSSPRGHAHEIPMLWQREQGHDPAS